MQWEKNPYLRSGSYGVPTEETAAPHTSLLRARPSNRWDSQSYCTLRSVYFSISTLYMNTLSS